MTLLHQIQEEIVKENADLSSVLLKLQLLASRLGSGVLEEWVRHESEGYPKDFDVPSYRIVGMTFKGTFLGPLGAEIRNAPIPTYIVEKHAGTKWTHCEVRESIAGISELLRMSEKKGALGIDASNLILLLEGKVYQEYTCNAISATISRSELVEIQQSVRSRILKLTLELEKSIPTAALVTFGAPKNADTNPEKVQQIVQNIICGNVNSVVTGSGDAQIVVKIGVRDSKSFIKYLVTAGMPDKDAKEFAEIIESEKPFSRENPFGDKAKTWLEKNLKKIAGGTWNIGISVAKKILTEAVSKYYGIN